MKEILISIRPEWVEKILDGSKTIEIRKTIPKCDLPCKVYIYCTKGQELWGDGSGNTWHGIDEDEDMERVFELTPTLARLNGKVVAEFTLNKVEELKNTILPTIPTCVYLTKTKRYASAVEKASCLSQDEIYNYLSGRDGYAWYIDDLIIYDKPKGLNEFRKPCISPEMPYCPDCKVGYESIPESEAEFYRAGESCRTEWCCLNFIKRPPQSWCYVELRGEE